jgi:hypothetical protein
MNGGYAIIDAEGLDLNNPGTVSGLYAQIKAAVDNDKPMVFVGIKNNTQKFSTIVAYGGIEDGGVFASFFPITIHVTSSDVVSI